MRTPTRHVLTSGEVRFKVRYRSGGKDTSETFRHEEHAKTFAALLDSGRDGVAVALRWLADQETRERSHTFGDWFEHYVDQLTGIEQRTRDDYRDIRRRYLSQLDLVPLPTMTRSHVTDTVNEMDRRGLAPKTIKNAINLLSSSLSLAVEEGHVAKNPCRNVRLPQTSLDEDEITFLTHDEFADLLREIPAHYRPLVFLLAGTGLRWSEATALQGQHVVGNTVRVRQAWKREKGLGWKLGPPKTPKSRRTVTLPANVFAALPPAKRGEFVFRTVTDRPVRHSNFYNRVWQPAVERVDLDPAPGIHSLRHSHVAWLIAAGTPLPVIQARLGHEKITTTIDTYGHLLPDLAAAAAEVAEVALGFLPALELSPASTASTPE